MKIRRLAQTCMLGLPLLVAHNAGATEGDGAELLRTLSTELEAYASEHRLDELMNRIRQTLDSAKLRSIDHHAYTIETYPHLFYDVTGLEKGQHPYHTTGDWDCDGVVDQAVLLSAPRSLVAVVLSSGRLLTHESEADALAAGEAGRHLTAAGKASGDGDGRAEFVASCGYVRAENWGKSSVALVADLEAGRLVAHRTSD